MNNKTKLGSDLLKTSTNNDLNFPAAGGTVATLNGQETLTQKTFTTPTINSPILTLDAQNQIKSNGGNAIVFPGTGGTVATLAGSETLEIKTIASFSNADN